MDLLGIGASELLLILLIVILVIGPRDIGKTARSIGRFLNRLYKSEEWRTLLEASRTLRTLPNRLAREAQLEELKEIEESLKEAKNEIEKAQKDLQEDLQKETKTIEQTQKELAKDFRSADNGMKSWIAPPKEELGQAAISKGQAENSGAPIKETNKTDGDPAASINHESGRTISEQEADASMTEEKANPLSGEK